MAISKKDCSAASEKLHGGPGGWHCPCCNPFGVSPAKMKARARRMVRRIENLRAKLEALAPDNNPQ